MNLQGRIKAETVLAGAPHLSQLYLGQRGKDHASHVSVFLRPSLPALVHEDNSSLHTVSLSRGALLSLHYIS